MLGFEHPSHRVTHPCTDEAQCCLTLEIFKPFELMMMKIEFLIMNYKDGQEMQISTTAYTYLVKDSKW